jgi:hypothetical protein
MASLNEIAHLQNQLKQIIPRSGGQLKKSLTGIEKELSSLVNSSTEVNKNNFNSLNEALQSVFDNLQSNDMPPTSQAIAAAEKTATAFAGALEKMGRDQTTKYRF